MEEASIDWERELRSLLSNGLSGGSQCFETEFSALADEEPPSSEQELSIEEAFNFEQYKEHVNMSCIGPQTDDTDPNSTPFASLVKKMSPVTDDNGVMKRILKSGTTQVFPKGLVDLHYNAYTEMNEIPFDSSYLRQEKPIQLNLGTNELYPGFQIAVKSMSVDEKSEFLIQPKYAFGKSGVPPRIPPDATILVQIEVFSSCAGKAEEELEDVHKFEVAYRKASKLHTLAKNFFNKRNIKSAEREYREAETLLKGAVITSPEEEIKMKELLQKTYMNLMTCYNRLGKYKDACTTAKEYASVDPDAARSSSKFFYHLAKSHLELGDFMKALRNVSKASSLQPNDPYIGLLYEKIKERKRRHELKEKIMCKKSMGFDSNDLEEKVKKIDLNEETSKDNEERFRQVAEQLISSCLAGREPVNFGHELSQAEWKIFEELCRKRGVKLEEADVRDCKNYSLVKGGYD